MTYEFKVLGGSPNERELNKLGLEGFFVVASGAVPKSTPYSYGGFVIVLQRLVPGDQRPH